MPADRGGRPRKPRGRLTPGRIDGVRYAIASLTPSIQSKGWFGPAPLAQGGAQPTAAGPRVAWPRAWLPSPSSCPTERRSNSRRGLPGRMPRPRSGRDLPRMHSPFGSTARCGIWRGRSSTGRASRSSLRADRTRSRCYATTPLMCWPPRCSTCGPAPRCRSGHRSPTASITTSSFPTGSDPRRTTSGRSRSAWPRTSRPTSRSSAASQASRRQSSASGARTSPTRSSS